MSDSGMTPCNGTKLTEAPRPLAKIRNYTLWTSQGSQAPNRNHPLSIYNVKVVCLPGRHEIPSTKKVDLCIIIGTLEQQGILESHCSRRPSASRVTLPQILNKWKADKTDLRAWPRPPRSFALWWPSLSKPPGRTTRQTFKLVELLGPPPT